MSAPPLADYLAAFPNAPATLTADTLADWLTGVDPAGVELADYRARCAGLAVHVTQATITAAQRGPDALADHARDLPRLSTGVDLDGLAVRLGPLVAPDRAALPVDTLASVHALWVWARRTAPTLKHPLAPIVRGWIEANRPAAPADLWPRATMPRMVTTERGGQPASIDVVRDDADWQPPPTLPDLGPLDLVTAPDLAYLPGLAPPDATPTGVVPAAWLALIDGMARADRDPREWQRSLRLLIEVVSAPDPRERRGVQRVRLPVGGPDGIIRRLWPNDGRVREHYPALRRALGLAVSAALPASDGRAFLPAQLDRWQRPDALTFNVTYPDGGGGGAAYDRALFRTYGVHPRTLRVYLAAVWALDARQLRRRDRDGWLADIALDALADLAAYPALPRSAVDRDNARRATRTALERLAGDGAIGGYDLAGRGSRQRLALWRSRPALPAPDADAGECG